MRVIEREPLKKAVPHPRRNQSESGDGESHGPRGSHENYRQIPAEFNNVGDHHSLTRFHPNLALPYQELSTVPIPIPDYEILTSALTHRETRQRRVSSVPATRPPIQRSSTCWTSETCPASPS